MRREDTVEHPDAVRVEHRAGVMRIVWDRAATGNAVDLDLARETLSALRRAEADPTVMIGGTLPILNAGHRVGRDRNDTSPAVQFIPAQRRLQWTHLFAQHQWRTGPWQLTLGAKAERNSYTGVEFLPNARVAYGPEGFGTTWASVSRTQAMS